MKEHLKTYTIELKVLGPVFVGSGKSLSKKEYLFKGDASNRYQSIQVIDIEKLYTVLAKKNLQVKFEDFMLNDRRDLRKWLSDNRIAERDLVPAIRYELPSGDTSLERGTAAQIMECMKDPYGSPYIPGSTIKGMLRTILLAYEYWKDEKKFDTDRRQLVNAAELGGKRNYYLNREIGAIERRAFHTLNRREGANADMLSSFIVGDSEPLTMNDIVLCQKIERQTDGSQKTLNILRECIRPGTVIRMPLTVDDTLCHYTDDDIREAVKLFIDQYYECFLSAFKGVGRLKEDRVLVGGGAGYVTKTVTYPLLGKKQGLEVAQEVFQNTLPPRIAREHKHYKDNHLGASPHILKCTRYEGKLCQMGLCSMNIYPDAE